ncbi:MAG: T9SS type A sorting domain-containing protein, partial [Bacteroidetes bacterium]|nr:T9SS type A sorting domain-containing protein [Bacteroidota bacterium]
QNAGVSTITINSGKSLTSETGQARELTVAGNFTNNGTFTANDGAVNITSVSTVSGTISFNNVNISAAVNFGASSTITGTLGINAGGSVSTNAPTYGGSSILKYNTGSVFGRGPEWSATSGAGYPQHVQVSNSTSVDLGNGGTGTARQIAGNITIDNGSALYMDYDINDMTAALTVSGNITINGNFSLSEAGGGDLHLKGNWTRGAAGAFDPNERAVFFDGNSGDQTISVTGGGTETFDYVIVNKSSGNVVLNNSPQTYMRITVTSGNVLTLSNGTIDLNGQQLKFEGQGGNFRIENADREFLGGAGSEVLFSGNPSTTSKFITSDGHLLTFNSNVKLIIQSGCVDFGSGIVTVNGTIEYRAQGCAITNANAFGPNSYLVYNTSGTFDRKIEWNDGTLQNVTVKNGTNLNMDDSGGDVRSMAGNLLIELGGVMDFNTRTAAVIVGGNVTIDGTLELADNAGGDMEVKGDWYRTGTLTHNTRMVTFNGTSDQTIHDHTTFGYLKINNSGGAEVFLATDIVLDNYGSVENGAVLNLGTYVVSGVGTFVNETGGTIKIGHLSGIDKDVGDATGNIQTTGGRTFDQDAIYHYIGAADQVTGDGLPNLISGGKVIVEMSTDPTTLTPNASRTIASGGELKIIKGTLVENGTGTIFSGAGNLIMSGGIYKFFTTQSTAGTSVHCPRLTGTYTMTGGAVELAADCNSSSKFQKLKGAGRIYYNVKISGGSSSGGYKNVSSGCTITNNLEITDNSIFDIESNGIDGDGGLTMSSGRLRMSKVSTSLPELDGINTPYNITGGTVEYYGTGSTQQQLIRGNYGSPSTRISYYNVEMNSSAANTTVGNPGNVNASESFTVQAGGTVTVYSPTVFRLDETDYIDGAGDVTISSGAALLYGSPNGIKTDGTGVSDGNIRISGTRTFPTDASYGFVSPGDMDVGNALPATVQNLYIYKSNNSDDVTLQQSTTANGSVSFYKGRVVTGSYTLLVDNSTAADVVDAASNNFADSYVIGNLKRKVPNSSSNTDVFDFPVGIDAYPRLAKYCNDNLEGVTYINATFSTTADLTTGTLNVQEYGVDIESVCQDGVWIIDPTGARTAGSYGLKLYFTGFSDLSAADDNKFTIIKRPSASADLGDFENGNGITSYTDGDGRLYSDGYAWKWNLTSFSQDAIGKTASAFLPVELLHFTAFFSGKQVDLSWATITETNNDYFTIERSKDLKDIKKIAVVQGAGNSNEIRKYTAKDADPQKGTVYYRLKQTDFDGKFSYSGWVAVQIPSAGYLQEHTLEMINVCPNPAREMVYFSYSSMHEGEAVVLLTDAVSGKITGFGISVEEGINTGRIDTGSLPGGVYLLTVLVGEERISRRIIVLDME